eukprot:gene22331-28433_t
MGAYLLRGNPKHNDDEPFWMATYLKMLRFCLRHRFLVVIATIIFFAGSIGLLVTIPSDTVPASDQSISQMSISLPPGSTLNETDAVVMRATKDLMKRPEVRSVYASESMQTASLIVNLVPINKRKLSQAQFEQDFSKTAKTYAGVRASFGQSGGSGGTGVAYILVSDNPDALREASTTLQRQMA